MSVSTFTIVIDGCHDEENHMSDENGAQACPCIGEYEYDAVHSPYARAVISAPAELCHEAEGGLECVESFRKSGAAIDAQPWLYELAMEEAQERLSDMTRDENMTQGLSRS